MAAASPHSPISTGLTAGSAPRALSEDDILAAAPYVRAARGESREHCLGRVTHIHVQRRRLTSLQGIHAAPQLKVVYAFENSITSLPADLTVCRHLQVLMLDSNQIRLLSNLTECHELEKLYLRDNCLVEVSGLEGCRQLQELDVRAQRSLLQSLRFADVSMRAIAGSLRILRVSGNMLRSLQPLGVCVHLEVLEAADNDLSDMSELLLFLQHAWYELRSLDVRGNRYGTPDMSKLQSQAVVAAAGPSFDTLNDVTYSPMQVVFLRRLHARRIAAGAAPPLPEEAMAATLPGAGSSPGTGFSIGLPDATHIAVPLPMSSRSRGGATASRSAGGAASRSSATRMPHAVLATNAGPIHTLAGKRLEPSSSSPHASDAEALMAAEAFGGESVPTHDVTSAAQPSATSLHDVSMSQLAHALHASASASVYETPAADAVLGARFMAGMVLEDTLADLPPPVDAGSHAVAKSASLPSMKYASPGRPSRLAPLPDRVVVGTRSGFRSRLPEGGHAPTQPALRPIRTPSDFTRASRFQHSTYATTSERVRALAELRAKPMRPSPHAVHHDAAAYPAIPLPK